MTPPLLSNSSGTKSLSFTMLVVTFTVMMLWMVLSMVDHVGSLHIRPFSSADAMAVFSPVALLYFGRKHQENQKSDGSDGDSEEPGTPGNTPAK